MPRKPSFDHYRLALYRACEIISVHLLAQKGSFTDDMFAALVGEWQDVEDKDHDSYQHSLRIIQDVEAAFVGGTGKLGKKS